MDYLPFVVFGLVAILVVVFGYLSYLAEKKRTEALRALAQELSWRFSAEKDYAHDEEYAHFEIFRRGHSRVAYNTLVGEVVVGEDRYPTKMGDFRYKVTSGSGKSRSTRTYNLSYLILRLPYPSIPSLIIRREGMFDWVAGAFGFDDVDFESAEFSREFYVKSSDKRFAYDVVHPRMIEFLMSADPPAIDIENGHCCISDGRRRWEPTQFRQMMEWTRTFLEHWPRHVKQDLQHSRHPA